MAPTVLCFGFLVPSDFSPVQLVLMGLAFVMNHFLLCREIHYHQLRPPLLGGYYWCWPSLSSFIVLPCWFDTPRSRTFGPTDASSCASIPQEVLPRHILGILDVPDEWFDKPTISRTWPYLIFKKKRLWILDGLPCISIYNDFHNGINPGGPAPSSPLFFRPNRRFSDDAVWGRCLRDGEVGVLWARWTYLNICETQNPPVRSQNLN